MWIQLFVFTPGTVNSTRGGMNDSNPCLRARWGRGVLTSYNHLVSSTGLAPAKL